MRTDAKSWYRSGALPFLAALAATPACDSGTKTEPSPTSDALDQTATGALDQPCRGGRACDAGLYCANEVTCRAGTDPCAGVTCSSRGVCVTTASGPACLCNDGMRQDGLDCVDKRGTLDAACRDGGACDGALVCGLGNVCVVDPCVGVTCSGHGTCTVTAGAATCACEPGTTASELSCLAPTCDGLHWQVVSGDPSRLTIVPSGMGMRYNGSSAQAFVLRLPDISGDFRVDLYVQELLPAAQVATFLSLSMIDRAAGATYRASAERRVGDDRMWLSYETPGHTAESTGAPYPSALLQVRRAGDQLYVTTLDARCGPSCKTEYSSFFGMFSGIIGTAGPVDLEVRYAPTSFPLTGADEPVAVLSHLRVYNATDAALHADDFTCINAIWQ